MPGGTDGQLLISPDDETSRLFAEFAERSQMPPEEAAVCWLGLQASAYLQDQEVAQLSAALTAREQQVVALRCLECSDHDIAAALDVAYGTASTHLYKAIDKLGINKKSSVGTDGDWYSKPAESGLKIAVLSLYSPLLAGLEHISRAFQRLAISCHS